MFATIAAAHVVAAPAHADAVTSSSTEGSTSATISWQEDEGEFVTEITALVLEVIRDGVIVRTGPLEIRDCPEPNCRPYSLEGGEDGARVMVRDIDDDPEPEVLVASYSGGAHCCSSLTVFDDAGGGQYRQVTQNFADGGIEVYGTASTTWFRTADARFAYRFGSFAASWLPFRAVAFDDGRFVDVTRRFPGLVRRDANRAWNRARRLCRSGDRYGEAMGSYAGWAAGQYRLGRRTAALRVLSAQRRAGCFRGYGSASFLRRLDPFLRRTVLR